MKKYIKPNIKIEDAEIQEMLAGSNLGIAEGTLNADASLARDVTLWDDDDDNGDGLQASSLWDE